MNMNRMPKNPVIQRRVHGKGDTGGEGGESPDHSRPSNAIVLYFSGQSDGSYVKLGIADSIPLAYKRLDAHTKSVAKFGQRYIFLAAAWAYAKDEEAIKTLWHHKMDIPGETELPRADADVRGYLRYLRLQQHCAQNCFADLEHLGFANFELWAPGAAHHRDGIVPELKEQPDFFETPPPPPGPWDDVLECEYGPINDYFTDDLLTDSVHEVFPDGFLDPASCELANSGNKNHKGVRAAEYYTPFQDGLILPWWSCNYLNPPFKQWPFWAPKIIKEYDSGRAREIIVYCTFQTATTKRFNLVLSRASASLITNGRINCWGPNASQAADGHLMAYLGHRPDEFCKAFARHGVVSKTWFQRAPAFASLA